MPVIVDFSLGKMEDGTLIVSMSPPTSIGGADIRFQVSKRFGSTSGLILKSVSSGYNNVSGINVTSSGDGRMSITINSPDTSGMDYGNYAYSLERFTSGSRSIITEGYLMVLPNVN